MRGDHPECRQRHEKGAADLNGLISRCFDAREDFYLHSAEINRIVADASLSQADCEQIYVDAFDRAIDRFLADGIIDDGERAVVARFIQFSGIPQSRLNARHSLEKVVQSQVLLDILNKRKPQPRITISGAFPFMLQKSETMLWLYRDVTLLEQKVRRQYVGRSRGVSMRIAKGVYYRTGGFRGEPIETTSLEPVDTGTVCLTDKHIYFHSMRKSLRIPLAKIITLDPYAD